LSLAATTMVIGPLTVSPVDGDWNATTGAVRVATATAAAAERRDEPKNRAARSVAQTRVLEVRARRRRTRPARIGADRDRVLHAR